MQCQAKSRQHNRQCKNHAVAGGYLCRVHSGNFKHGMRGKLESNAELAKEHLERVKQIKAHEKLLAVENMLAAVLSYWGERGYVNNPKYHRPVGDYVGRLLRTIQTRKELELKANAGLEGSQAALFVRYLVGEIDLEAAREMFEGEQKALPSVANESENEDA